MTTLDSSQVPEKFRRLIPLAERWGIGDDFLREEAVRKATGRDLEELLAFREDFDAVAEWLAGPESYSSHPTPEYIAFSDLAMAWELANLIVKQHAAA